jgi:hypothetical protein
MLTLQTLINSARQLDPQAPLDSFQLAFSAPSSANGIARVRISHPDRHKQQILPIFPSEAVQVSQISSEESVGKTETASSGKSSPINTSNAAASQEASQECPSSKASEKQPTFADYLHDILNPKSDRTEKEKFTLDNVILGFQNLLAEIIPYCQTDSIQHVTREFVGRINSIQAKQIRGFKLLSPQEQEDLKAGGNK